MKTYLIKATGRQSGAIGVIHPFTETVQASDPAQAVGRLYTGATDSGKAWEHITGILVKRIEANSPCHDDEALASEGIE